MKKIACSQCGKVVQVGDDTIRVTCGICSIKAMRPVGKVPDGQPKRRVPAAVRSLVKRECCNHWDAQHWGEVPCRVLLGRRCRHFERALLPVATEQARHGYEDLIGGGPRLRIPTGRFCECGAPLARRHRFCDACKRKKRRKSYRQAKRRERKPKAVHS